MSSRIFLRDVCSTTSLPFPLRIWQASNPQNTWSISSEFFYYSLTRISFKEKSFCSASILKIEKINVNSEKSNLECLKITNKSGNHQKCQMVCTSFDAKIYTYLCICLVHTRSWHTCASYGNLQA